MNVGRVYSFSSSVSLITRVGAGAGRDQHGDPRSRHRRAPRRHRRRHTGGMAAAAAAVACAAAIQEVGGNKYASDDALTRPL